MSNSHNIVEMKKLNSILSHFYKELLQYLLVFKELTTLDGLLTNNS